MYAPPAALGPKRQHTCGTRPDRRTWLAKMRPAPRRPGNSSTWSVIRAPAESTRYTTGISWRRAVSVRRTIFSTVRAPHEPALTVGSLAMTHTGRPSMRPVPVTTPSAGRSSARALASRPSSTNDPLVEEHLEPVADEHLALLGQLGAVAVEVPPPRPGRPLGDALVGHRRGSSRAQLPRRRTRSLIGVGPRSNSSRSLRSR